MKTAHFLFIISVALSIAIVLAAADRLDANNIEAAIINIISHSNDPVTICVNETTILHECMQSSGDTLECTECMLNGLVSTKPITCHDLEVGGVYCQGVSHCFNMKCKNDCREEYYDKLNCLIQNSCSDVVECSPQDLDLGMPKITR